ncbi:hypothetical protein DFH07DRAFT_748911, partial [Mycena maculata]
RGKLYSRYRVCGAKIPRYGVGGSSTLGRSSISTIGSPIFIPRPDFLWSAQVDGGWSRLGILDIPTVVAQIEVILRLIYSLDAKHTQETPPATP